MTSVVDNNLLTSEWLFVMITAMDLMIVED
jgi:hypothetical protein